MKKVYLDGSEPGVKALLTKAGYTGQRISAAAAESITPLHTYFDGGIRHKYVAAQLATGEQHSLPPQNPPQFGGPAADQPVRIPQGFALIEITEGDRRYSAAHIWVHPADMPNLLPASDAVTTDQQTVLKYTAELKNTYGGETDIRFRRAAQDTGITRTQWDAAQAACIAAKLLRKNGSITPAGRNAS